MHLTDFEVTCNSPPDLELVFPDDEWTVWAFVIATKTPADLGAISIDPEATNGDFVVKIANGVNPGVANLTSAVLNPSTGYASSVASGSHISGDLLGSLTVVEDSSDNGGELSLDIDGSAGGLISAYDVIDLVVGGNFTGNLEVDFISGTAEITGNCPGDIVVYDELSGGTLEVGGSVTDISTIDIADMVTDGTGSFLKFNTVSGTFEGKLFLETGVPSGQEVVINGALDAPGWIDLNEAGVAGNLHVYGGGSAPIGDVDESDDGGSVTGTVVLGKDANVYEGTATFTSVSGSGSIETDDADFDGDLSITGNMSGHVEVDGVSVGVGNLGGSISVGGYVASSKEILIDGDVEAVAGISVEGNLNGDIDVDGDLAGDISVGTVGTPADVTTWGNIEVAGDVVSGASIDVTGDLAGSIEIDYDVDGSITVGGDISSSGDITVLGDLEGNGSITVSGDAAGGGPQAIYIDGNVVDNGSIGVGNLTGTLRIVGNLAGDVTLGVLAGTLNIGGTLSGPANVLVTQKMYGATWEFLGAVDTGANIQIQDMQSNGGTHSELKFGQAGNAFDGTLTLFNGIPANQSVGFYGDMDGEVDLNNKDVDGTLDLDDGGSGHIIDGGTVNSTTVHLAKEGYAYSGVAYFTGVASGKRVWTRAGDLSGTIDITGSLAGKVAVGEALQSGGNVSGNGQVLIGVDVLSTGFIEVIGYMDGLIDVDGDIVEDGTIDVDGNMDGVIDIGGDFDGEILVGGNMTGGSTCANPGIYVYGDVECGTIDVDGSIANGYIDLDTGAADDEMTYNGDISASNLSAGVVPSNVCIDEVGLAGKILGTVVGALLPCDLQNPNSCFYGHVSGTGLDCSSNACTVDACDADQNCCVYACKNQPYGDIQPIPVPLATFPCDAEELVRAGDEFVTMLDVMCAFNAMNDGPPHTACPCADVAPCGGDGFLTMLDVTAILNAMNDPTSALCPDPCACYPCMGGEGMRGGEPEGSRIVECGDVLVAVLTTIVPVDVDRYQNGVEIITDWLAERMTMDQRNALADKLEDPSVRFANDDVARMVPALVSALRGE